LSKCSFRVLFFCFSQQKKKKKMFAGAIVRGLPPPIPIVLRGLPALHYEFCPAGDDTSDDAQVCKGAADADNEALISLVDARSAAERAADEISPPLLLGAARMLRRRVASDASQRRLSIALLPETLMAERAPRASCEVLSFPAIGDCDDGTENVQGRSSSSNRFLSGGGIGAETLPREPPELGDVILCIARIRDANRAFSVPFAAPAADGSVIPADRDPCASRRVLDNLAHALSHLAGHDHADDTAHTAMEEHEAAMLAGLPRDGGTGVCTDAACAAGGTCRWGGGGGGRPLWIGGGDGEEK
jgi:ssRNA-specific RNase YbeY (16S rRNA maturation enzyme)